MSDPQPNTQLEPLDTPSDTQTGARAIPRPEVRASSRNTQNGRLGLLLIGAGALFLLARSSLFDFGDAGWPLFVLVPGLLLLALGLRGSERASLLVPGAVVSTIGLILFWQNATGRFETWAYLWALLPAAAAGGAWLRAHLHAKDGDNDPYKDGAAARKARARRDASRALGLFAVFALFFELFIFGGLAGVLGSAFGVLGGVLGSVLLPLALIALGLYLLEPWKRGRS